MTFFHCLSKCHNLLAGVHFMKKLLALTGIGLLSSQIIVTSFAQAAVNVNSKIPAYHKASDVSDNIASVGSDILANLMSLWAKEFKRLYSNVNLQIQAAGSSTALPALTEGISNFGPMSRRMKDKELQAFEKRFGYKPTFIPVAIDALAVYVNKDNPIKGLSISQVDAIFSSTRKCGFKTKVNTWGDLGITDSWKNRNLQIFGRNSVSGTYGYFKNKALCKGDYKLMVNEQPGSASVVQSVAASFNGIGYSGLGYKTSGVHAVPLTKNPSKPYIAASTENAASGKYPLSRLLYIYVNKKPNKPLALLEYEFIRMALSKLGQKIVIQDRLYPS